jgi:hypothetical protein
LCPRLTPISHNRKDDIVGQYHIPINLTKKEFIHPHRLGNGLKLWEQGASQFGVSQAIHALLAVSNGRGSGDYHDDPEFVGRWGGDRIAIVGDYAEPGDLPAEDRAECIYRAREITEGDALKYYPTEEEREERLGPYKPGDWKDISDLAVRFLCAEYDLEASGTGWITLSPVPGSFFDENKEARKDST